MQRPWPRWNGAVFPCPGPKSSAAQPLPNWAFAGLGLWTGRTLCGYISVYHTADELEILNLAVSPDLRRRGLGRRLLRTALRHLPPKGVL